MIPDFSTSVAWGGAVLAQLAETLPGRQESVLDMVVGSGPVVRAVLLILLAFSVGCWGIALAKSVEMRRARRQSERFGTVWGIMTAFRGLSTTTSSSIQAVAPGIAEALIATAVGLAAAIPAVVMYNRFSRQLRVLTAEMDTFASEFLNIAERHFLK